LDRTWRDRGAERGVRRPVSHGRPVIALDEHPDRGYLLRVDGVGAYGIARDGSRALLAPEPIEGWRWQRLLTAQVLPIAALAQGLELFHASAVSLHGHLLAFTGPSGAGKTTLAAQLMLAGANFVSDDVLAVERVGDELIAHPGPGLMNLRHSAARLFTIHERRLLGSELGRDEAGSRMLVRREARALPLGALYLLRRAAGRSAGVDIARLSAPSPRLLLAAGFGAAIQTPARLVRRLDLCADLARRTAVFALEAPANAPPAALADAVLRHTRRNAA
jgi:hypothetical protein